MKNTILMLAALAATGGPATAQQAPATLSLEEAVALARQHNPDYRSRLNDEGVSDWDVRSAYAAFLPTASVSGGLSYEAGGQSRLGSFTTSDIGIGTTPDYYFSSYSLNVGLNVSGDEFYRIGQQKSARRALVASLEAASNALEATVTRQYLAALRARDAVELAGQELERAEANLSLAEARYAVEAGTVIETKQAEVERGRAEVALLRAEAGHDTEKLRLLQQIGVNLNRDVELTTEVRVFEPAWDLGTLLAAASSSQPELVASRASLDAAESGIGVARSAYWPSLSLSTGLSGFTRRAGSDEFLIEQAQRSIEAQREQCMNTNIVRSRLTPPLPPMDCSEIAFTEQTRQGIIASNREFPFNFDTDPMSLSLGVSLPIFQGLTRQRQLEAAHAQVEDARFQARADELRIQADVETAYLNLEAAYRAAMLEESNREVADDQLRLARERYRVGSASFIELLEAETLKARADRDYLLGVYSFQEALTALEAAVGQPLAIPEN